MANKRKYPEVKGWWVYSIKVTSNGKYYIGVSKQKCCIRWRKSAYKTTVLKEYLSEWDSLEKTVLIDGLSSKEEALIYEDAIIRGLKMNNLCINEQRSGLITSDKNNYQRELYKNNTEYRERQKQYEKQCYENDVEYREKVNQRAKQWQKDNREKYNEYHKQHRLKKRLEREQQHTAVP